MNELKAKLFDFLAELFEARIPILKTWEFAMDEFPNEMVLNAFDQSMGKLQQGESLANSLDGFPGLFNPFDLAMLNLAEEHIAIEGTLRCLSQRYEAGGIESDTLENRWDLFFDLLHMRVPATAILEAMSVGLSDQNDVEVIRIMHKDLMKGVSFLETSQGILPIAPHRFISHLGGLDAAQDLFGPLAFYFKNKDTWPGGDVRSGLYLWRIGNSIGIGYEPLFQILEEEFRGPRMGWYFEAVLQNIHSTAAIPMKDFPHFFTPAVIELVFAGDVHGDIKRNIQIIEEGMDRGLFLPPELKEDP